MNIHWNSIALLLFLGLIGTGCQPEDTGSPVITPILGKVYESTCISCHGTSGEGNRELGAPSIASLPTWYVAEQLRKFREEQRGTHPEDIPGQQMRAISLLLSNEAIEEVSSHIAAMPPLIPTQTGTATQIEMGRKLYANSCMECHRYNGSGDQFFKSAPLTGLQDWYHIRQLRNYRDGLRGANVLDNYGQKMAKITNGLTDEQIDALGVYMTALANGDDPRKARER